MNICDYGCGREAKYQFKNGKMCCSKHYRSCPHYRKMLQKENNPFYGKTHTEKTKKLLSLFRKKYKMSDEAKEKIINSTRGPKNHNYGKTWKDSEETKVKKSNANKGNVPWNKGKKGYLSKEHLEKLRVANEGKVPWNKNITHTTKTRKKLSIANRLSIKQIKEKYPIFSKVEEMRYNPNKPGEKEIQVHCKNHKCENSKEKGGWFTPSFSQIQQRKNQLEKVEGNDGSYFYCSQECKDSCMLYNLRTDPFEETEFPHTNEEYNIWKQTVLEQDNYECQKCGSKENLHCHHIVPVKENPMLALDPDNGILLCQKCHYEIGHKTGTECSTGNLANKRKKYCEIKN